MTTNMNFGPEWMRPVGPKRSNTLDSHNLRSLQSASVVPNDRVNIDLDSISPLVSNHSSSLQHNFNNGLSNEHLKNPDDQDLSSAEAPYKYSSAFMLSLYKPVDMPSEFERHDYVAVEESQVPLSFVPLSGEEKKLLSNPVHSDTIRRTGASSQERGSNNGQRNNSNHMHLSPVQTPPSENASGGSGRMGALRSKGRMHDYFSQDQHQQNIMRHDYGLDTSRQPEWVDDHTTNRSYESEQEETPSWDSVSQNAIGTFDSNGVFRISSTEDTELEPKWDAQGELDESRESTEPDLRNPHTVDAFMSSSATTATTTFSGVGLGMQNEVGGPASLFGGHETRRSTTQHKWFYRDPMGNPLGPFDAHDMQAWFDAGYFSPNFLVRRDDETQFDTLASVIRKSGYHDEPFLSNYYTPQSRNSPDSLEPGSLTPRSRGFDSLHYHHAATAVTKPTNPLVSPASLEPPRGDNYFGNASQASDRLSHSVARFSQLNVSPNYLQQQVGQGPSSPHSPTVFQGSSFSGFGPSLLANRDPNLHWGENPRSPSSLNNTQIDFFGAGEVQMVTPAFRQEQQQHLMNQMHVSDLGSPGFYDYPRTIAEQRGQQQQQYIQILQLQQQQQFQFQRQFQQQQAMLLLQRQQLQEFHELEQQQRHQLQEFHELEQQQADFARLRESRRLRMLDPPNQGRSQASVERAGIPSMPRDRSLVRPSVPEEHDPASKDATTEALIQSLSGMQLKHEGPAQLSPAPSPLEVTTALPTEPALQRDLQSEEIRRQHQVNGQDSGASENGRNAPLGFGQQSPSGPSKRIIQIINPNTSKAPTSVPETTISSIAGDSSFPPAAASKKTPRRIQLEEPDTLEKTNALAIARATGSKGWSSSAPLRNVVKTKVSTDTASAVPRASQSSTTQGREAAGLAKNNNVTSMPARRSMTATAESKSFSKTEGGLKPPSEEFMKWCCQSLRGLSSGVNADEILQMLLSFPLDEGSSEIIQDIIYANSTSMDGRRFAEDFMKRRKEDIAGKLTMSIPMMNSATLEEMSFKVVTKKGKKKTAA